LDIAEILIRIYGDIEIRGSAVVDGIQSSWEIADGLSIHNTSDPDLEPVSARITNISYDLENLTTAIEFTNRPSLANSDLQSHINTKYKLEKASYEINQITSLSPATS